MTPSLCLFYMLNEEDITQKEKRRNYFGLLKKNIFDGNLKSTELHKKTISQSSSASWGSCNKS